MKFYNKYSQIGRHAVDHKIAEKTQSLLLLILKRVCFMGLKFPIKITFYSNLIVSFAPGSLPAPPLLPPPILIHSGLLALF